MSDLAQPLQQQQQSQRRRQRNGRAPKYPSSNGDQTFAQSNNRRIYDLRRWHRHKSADKLGACQPPAGWVLVWAGRFKRWRRRWFVAHPPGLLLYYKNSDQLGRSGCINLLGADVAPSAGKERQLKIRKGARVYYLRTLNKENRQAWLDAISKSIRTYENSFQKAAVGSKSGALISFHQSMPSHLVEEWEAQERELNRRLARRMREIDPMRQAFLQQLQTLQHSLGVISGALGFTSQSGMGGTASVAAISANHVETGPGVGMVGTPRPSLSDLDTSSQKVDGSLLPVVKIQGSSSSHNNNATAPTHGRSTDRDCQVKLISSLSEPIPSNYIEKRVTAVEGQRCQSQQSTAEDTFSSPEYELLHEQGSCIGREFFRRRRRQTVGVNPLEKGHSSDTEVWSSSSSKRPSLSNKDVNGKNKYVQAELHPSCSVDRFSTKYATGILVKENGNANALGGSVQNSNRQRGPSCNGCKGISSGTMSSSPSSNSTIYPIQGPLHAAWNTMQDAFAEILKEEIHRVMELEAENAVLQQSLVMLPQLQQDHKDLLDLREQMQLQRDNICTANTTDAERDVDGEDGDDEETDDEVSVVHSEVTNEDYYEALEVLNQHDFIAKATSPEELEVLAERAECTQDPPEESDILVDAENSEAEGEDYEHPRTRLPAPRPLSRGFSLWTVLKNAIGKDLNHITMPATINEPLSTLQRCAEELQYGYLIEKASQLDDSIERLVWVSVFACATYHGSPHRDAKPFNPLLGETYEWQAPDGKLRFISEQVSHHPPVLAFHSESTVGTFSIYGEVEIKNRFWGKSVEVFPEGVVHLRIPRFGDHFTWSKITTCIHNIVVGKLWIDNYGELVIRNHSTGDVSRIRFHKASSSEQGHVTGKVFDNKGILRCSIHGNYMKEISISPDPSWMGKELYSDSQCLWKCPELPEDYEQQYCFSRFTIGLNELTPKLKDALPPTDSRFRPDQRALEDGNLEMATPEKLRLEEKQRQARKKRKEQGQEWKCRWFQQRVLGASQVKSAADGDAEPTWIFNGQYWDARESRAWQDCPDIM